MKALLGIIILLLPYYCFSTVNLATEGGSGESEDDPILISSLGDLISIRWAINTNSTLYYKQTCDIDASTWEKSFKPIGNHGNKFPSHFDGQGYNILGLSINQPEMDCVGLFGVTSGAVIKNVNLVDCHIIGKSSVGTLIGSANADTQVINCSSSGASEGISTQDTGTKTGGLVGFLNNSSVKNSYSLVNVTCPSSGGGLVGMIANSSSVLNSYYRGKLNVNEKIGGIGGEIIGPYNSDALIQDCYAVVCSDSTNQGSFGLIIGDPSDGRIENCLGQAYQGLTICGNQSNAENNIVLNPNQMIDIDKYTNLGWDTNTTWLIDDDVNDGYPINYWQQTNQYALFEIDESSSQISNEEIGIVITFNDTLTSHHRVLVNKISPNSISTAGLEPDNVLYRNEYVQIKTTLQTPIGYTLSLTIEETDIPLSGQTLHIYKRENEESNWIDVEYLGGSLDWDENIVTISNLNSFSEFTLVRDVDTLPVELTSFTAISMNNKVVKVNWTVASESNLAGYYLYNCEINDLSGAEIIPELISAQNTTQGNTYEYLHQLTNNSSTQYYWLKSVEMNQENTIYGPVSVRINHNNTTIPYLWGDNLFPAFPNPFNPSTNISFSVSKPQQVKIEIYNTKGQFIKRIYDKYTDVINKKQYVVWDGSDQFGNQISSGIYLIRLELAEETLIRKAVLQK